MNPSIHKTTSGIFQFKPALIMALCILFLATCTNEINEQELYNKEISGFDHKIYKTLSLAVSVAALHNYNQKTDSGKAKIALDDLHLLAGLLWFLGHNGPLTFAECNIIEETSNDAEIKTLAHMLKSAEMYEYGWPKLAKEEAAKGIALLKTNPKDTAEIRAMVFHTILAAQSFTTRNYDASRFHCQKLSAIIDDPTPFIVTDAMCDIEAGKLSIGLQKLRNACTDTTTPAWFKAQVKQSLDEFGANQDQEKARAFWSGKFSGMLFSRQKGKESELLRSLSVANDLILNLGM